MSVGRGLRGSYAPCPTVSYGSYGVLQSYTK